MSEIQKEYRAAARERKRKSHEEKKSSEKASFLQELIFSFQKKSRGKYSKLQVVSKQVEKFMWEHLKSFKGNAQFVQNTTFGL